MDIRKIENKIVFFLFILVGLKFFYVLLKGLYYPLINMLGLDTTEYLYEWIYAYLLYFKNFIFSIILFFKSRNEIKDKYIVSILGLFNPVFALVFYFIESEMILKGSNKLDNG